MDLEKKFFESGGLLLVGTDPTGYGGVVAGYSNMRAIELLVEAGLTPLEALQVASFNGARYLDSENDLGTIETGKIADLVVRELSGSDNFCSIFRENKPETPFQAVVGNMPFPFEDFEFNPKAFGGTGPEMIMEVLHIIRDTGGVFRPVDHV